jgi:hypothetical protein
MYIPASHVFQDLAGVVLRGHVFVLVRSRHDRLQAVRQEEVPLLQRNGEFDAVKCLHKYFCPFLAKQKNDDVYKHIFAYVFGAKLKQNE